MRTYVDEVTGLEVRSYTDGPERNAKLYFTTENFSADDRYFFFTRDGVGLMRAVLFTEQYPNAAVCKKLRENKLILIPAGCNALRFLPPLNVKASEVDKALNIFEKTIERL